MKLFLHAGVAVLLAWGLRAEAQFVDPSLRWRTLDTEHFSVHFAEHYRSQAQVVAEVAESVYPRVTGWLKWKPESRTQIVVLDSLDFSNGYASPFPFNFIGIILSPPDEGELLQNREWLELVLTHEFTHIVHLDQARGPALALRRIFGRYLVLPLPFTLLFPSGFPNLLEPNWMIEGLAVYSESDWNKGYGRLGQSHFEGMMRAESARGLRSLREVNAEGRGFPLNRDYLYGSYFFMFLAERYGPDAIPKYVEIYSSRWFPFRVHSTPKLVTGKAMDELWLEYYDWLGALFAAKPEESGKEPDEGGELIVHDWSITSPLRTREGDRWYVQGNGYTLPRLMRQTLGGEVEAVRNVEPGTRLAALPRGELLLSQPEICNNYNYYYDLYRLGPGGGLSRVTECGRFRFAAPLDDGRIVAIRVVNGEAEVVLLNSRGELERSLYRATPGEALTGLAAKGETAVVTSLRNERWSLVEITEEKASALVTDRAVKHSPRFGDSADEIYFVADYGNVDNVWSWRRRDRSLARWTEARNGVKEISAPAAGEMLLTTIEADGDVLRVRSLPDAPLEVRQAAAEAGASAAPPEGGARGAPPSGTERSYSAWSSLRPRYWLPIGYAADGAVALGLATGGQDALGLHQYSLAPMYEITQHQALGSAAYVYDNRHGLLLNRWMTVKARDSSTNDVKAYTVDETAQWVSLWRHLSFNTRYYWGLGGALDRETFHQVDIGSSATRDERVLGLVAGVDTRRQQFLSEGPSQGQNLRLFAETSNGLRGAYSGNFYRGDWRAYLPAGRTVVSLRWNQAYSQSQAEPIQLGGLGASFSENAFALPVLNQREFPLRGYRSGEAVLTGHRASLATLEWRIPISDIDRHFMVPPVGVNRISMSVFTEAGAAWDNAPQHWYKSGGVELLYEARAGYLVGAQLRAGVAKGFETPGRTEAYVRIGRSF
jgi:hypothetical protein